MAQGVHKITADFEAKLCDYTGAPYAVAVDNQSNALFLALYYFYFINYTAPKEMWRYYEVSIPARTYPSVPCEIMHVSLYNYDALDYPRIKFEPVEGTTLKGAYQLKPTPIWDSALRFTANMYVPGQFQCLSFTGPYKHLKLGKGGAILTDNEAAYKWFKKARFSGRDECSYHTDDFDKDSVIGWNFYMMPEIAARGLLLMTQFYDHNGKPKENSDLELPYPDLSKFKCYR